MVIVHQHHRDLIPFALSVYCNSERRKLERGEAMRRRGKELLSLCCSSLHSSLLKRDSFAKSPSLACGFHGTTTTFSTSSSSRTPSVEEVKESSTSKSERDSMILDQFRQRKLKGSPKDSKGSRHHHPHLSTASASSSSCGASAEKVAEKGLENEGESTMVVSSFKELGLSEELAEVLEGIDDFAPTEIQCVVIPSILEGNSVLISSPAEPDRTLAYLLPLIQLLRRDGEWIGSNSKHPQAIVLCATEEKAAQCFSGAEYIIQNAKLKLAKGHASSDIEHSNASIGLLIGTPFEILQYIEEGSLVPAEIKYLVLDEVDSMLGSSLCSEIHKILKPLQDHQSKSTVKRLQTVLVTSTITEVLGDQSPIVKHLERDHVGNISAMSLEMDQTEVFHYTESMDALRKKLAEAMDTLF